MFGRSLLVFLSLPSKPDQLQGTIHLTVFVPSLSLYIYIYVYISLSLSDCLLCLRFFRFMSLFFARRSLSTYIYTYIYISLSIYLRLLLCLSVCFPSVHLTVSVCFSHSLPLFLPFFSTSLLVFLPLSPLGNSQFLS